MAIQEARGRQRAGLEPGQALLTTPELTRGTTEPEHLLWLAYSELHHINVIC